MLTTVAKKIQSRLSRAGVKATLGDIKDYLKVNVSDVENITDSDVNIATDYFINASTQLTVINEELSTLSTSVDNEEIVISGESAIAPDDQDQDYPEQTPKAGELATTNKSELVVNAAQSLGVVLNDSEIELIATNVNCSSDDLQETLEEIKGAIIAFIKHRIATNSQKIEETLNEIVEVASAGFNSNSEQLTNGLRSINQQLQQQSQDFKSKVKTTLKCFQLPEAS